MASDDQATFSGRITLRRRPPHGLGSIVDPATMEPKPDTAGPVDDDPTPLRDEIRLGELDAVLEEAIKVHWPELDANVVTTHTDK